MKMEHDQKERLMNLCNILFTRYLLRQRLISLIVGFVVCAITNLTVILASQGQEGVVGIVLLIIIISIWFFPLYLSVITIINYFNLKKELLEIGPDQELLDKMTHQLIRELILKNGVKISIFVDKKSDSAKFNEIVNEEIKFQRKKIELLKSN